MSREYFVFKRKKKEMNSFNGWKSLILLHAFLRCIKPLAEPCYQLVGKLFCQCCFLMLCYAILHVVAMNQTHNSVIGNP